MMPTFSATGDFVLVEALSLRFPFLRPLARGDIVTFVSPLDAKVSVCKRIVGLQGDKVYLDPHVTEGEDWIKVPKGHVWVLGDNLDSSRDSRMYGPVSLALLRGRVAARVRFIHDHGT